MFSRRLIRYGVYAWPVVGFLYACHVEGIDRFLHSDFTVVWPPPSVEPRSAELQPITPKQACRFAVQHLLDRGVKDIVICELRWIAAPLGGYLVDAQGILNLDENIYTLFRVGIRDGTEEAEGINTAGEEFVFIALGKNRAGEAEWYPHPGPDYRTAQAEPVPDELLAYELLLDREEFVSLAKRYQ